MKTTHRARIAMVTTIASVAAAAVSSSAAPQAVAPSPNGAVFPLDETFPLPTVPVRIGDHGPFLFILDTGAAGTLVDAGLAAELGLESRGTVEVRSPLGSGGKESAVVALSGVRVGPLDVPDFEATTFDLRELLGGGTGGGDVPLGVLSPADLGDRLVTFDFAARQVEIADGSLPAPDGAQVFEYDGALPELPVEISGSHHQVHVDTGSPGGLSLPKSVAASLPLRGELAVVGQARLVDTTVEIWGAPLDGTARVGGIDLVNPQVTFLEGAPIGNVGNEFLAGRVLTIDPRHHRIRLTEAEMSATKKLTATTRASEQTARAVVRVAPGDDGPVRRTMSGAKGRKRYGIRFAGGISGSPIRVAGVDEGSPAWDAGLRGGDLIEQLNGVGVGDLGQSDRIAALRGSPLDVVVRRGDELLQLSMTLE